MSPRLRRVAALTVLMGASSAFAGGPLAFCSGSSTPLRYTTPAANAPVVSLNYDGGGNLGLRTKAEADAIVTTALAMWTSVPTATITLQRGADLPVDVTTSNYSTYLGSFTDGLNPVIYDSDGSIVDLLLGTGAKNSVLGFAGSGGVCGSAARFTEGRAVINGSISVSDATMTNVLAHELGHFIGLDHSQLDSAQGLSASNYPLMYPIAYRTLQSLGDDDAAAVTMLYPDATVAASYGTLDGTFMLADGVTPIRGANIWARETTTNKVYSVVSDYLMQGNGAFRMLLPPGTYTLRAQAIKTQFTGGSSVGPYSENYPSTATSPAPSFDPPLYVGGSPMAALTLGNASPVSFTITAGCTATATFKFDGTGNVTGCGLTATSLLTVSKSGTGAGTVTSVPAGMNCGATCSAGFATGSTVALTATPSPGSVFAGWSGACSGTGPCNVTVSAATAVTATFTASAATATLTVSSTGGGVVSSSPGGISCGVACSASFAQGSTVTLTAAPSSGLFFKGWAGACAGTGNCAVTMSANTAVSATFGNKANASLALASSANPVYEGQPLVLSARASGNSGVPGGSVSFTLDGSPIAACSALPLANGYALCGVPTVSAGAHALGASYSGDPTYDPAAAAPLTLTASATPAVGSSTARLVNIATRGKVLAGNDVMIGGFIIGGSQAKTVVVRARGPSMAAAGVTGTLQDPVLQLFQGQTQLAINDNWQQAANAAALQSSGFAPSDPREAAVLATLAPGAYTAIVSGSGGTTGIGLAEVFELDHPETPLVNIATRGQVLTGNDVMIGGFIIQGNGPQTVVVRARGPSLIPAGVANAMANPTMQIIRSTDGATLASNDDWATGPNSGDLAASGFAPANSVESAVLVTLDPGAYTVIVSGAAGSTGVGIVEVFAR